LKKRLMGDGEGLCDSLNRRATRESGREDKTKKEKVPRASTRGQLAGKEKGGGELEK